MTSRARGSTVALSSLPMYVKYGGLVSVNDVQYERLTIKFKDPSNVTATNIFLKDFRQNIPLQSLYTVKNQNDL